MSQQRTVSLPAEEESEDSRVVEEESEDSRVVEEEKKATSAFFYEYISKRADKDQEMKASDAEIIQEQREQAVKAVEDVSVINVAAVLADLGDRIDADYHQEMNKIIELTSTPESAYTTFLYVVQNLFTWDENGRAVINMGRIAALMAYCYSLCKTYITKKVATRGLIVTFIGLVSGWLFKSLIKAKFYEWLQKQGGWGQLILSASSNARPYSIVLMGSVAVLAFMAFSYFRNR